MLETVVFQMKRQLLLISAVRFDIDGVLIDAKESRTLYGMVACRREHNASRT